MTHNSTSYSLPAAALLIVPLVLVLTSCSSPQSTYRPPYEPPRPVPPPRPTPPPPLDPCIDYFDPCNCELAQFRIDLLDERLEMPGDTATKRAETAANLRKTANDYKNEYWSTREHEAGLFALRFYDGYLRLVPLSDGFAPFALLHSVSIYCGLGCPSRAEDLARELRYTYRHKPAQIEQALSYCE